MKRIAGIVFVFSCLGSCAFAQVSPAATSSTLVSAASGLQYAFRYAESAILSSSYTTMQTSTVSGSVGYANRNQKLPFTMNYAGGYNWTLSGPDYMSGQFHRMELTQDFIYRRWKLNAGDSVSYLPQAPLTGFSGIPGIGEIIGLPNPNPSQTQTILTLKTHVVDNEARLSLEHTLNYATSVIVGGTSSELDFPDDNGINTRSWAANGALARRLSARTTILGRYRFSQFDFSGTDVSMHTTDALFGFDRRVTRKLSVSASGGPEWIDSTVASAIPAQNTYALNGSATYSQRVDSFGASYAHGTNGGAGYLFGGIYDSASGNYLRMLNRNFTLGLTGGYYRTVGLNRNGVTTSGYGATQVTWQLSRNLIVFGNYTGTSQSTTSVLSGNVFTGTFHNISFGFGLSPRERRATP